MMVSKRFFLSVASLSLVFVLVGQVSAAGLTDYVNTKSRTVSRGDFLSWTLKAFSIDLKSGDCELSFDIAPTRYKKTLCTMQERGALNAVFPAPSTDFTKPISRGDALILLTVFTNTFAQGDIAKFRDTKTNNTRLTQAISTAIAKKWMTPLTSTYFGAARNLTGTEALSLLQAVTNQNPVKQKVQIKLTIPSPQAASSASIPHEELIRTVWQLLQRDYLRSDSVDTKEASYKMIEGLVNSMGDPYTTFFRPVQADQFQTQIKGELTGIGAHVEIQSGSLVIITPLPNSPAEKAGLQPGDIILKADNTSLIGMSIDQAVSYIRGEKGTSVVLTIKRGSTQMQITVVRSVISIPEIDVSFQGSVAILKLAQFGETTDGNIRPVLEKIAAKNPSGLILDLRNNPGGLLHAADMLMSGLVPKDSIVAQVKGKVSSSNERTDFTPIISADTPIAVLVNAGSASASEIVAGALQDYKRAKIVGTKSFGKGTVQEVLSFAGGEALKITVAEWLTPLGRKIDGIGVMPDIVTTDTATPDQELKAAMNALR